MGVSYCVSPADDEVAQLHFGASIPADAVDVDRMLLSIQTRKIGKAGHPRTAGSPDPMRHTKS